MAKKIQKNCTDDLHPGEVIEAGTFVQERGSFSRSIGVGVGGAIGAATARAATATVEPPASDVGVAADFPDHRIVLGLSAQRLMAFKHGSFSGKPKELVVSVPLASITEMTAEKHKATYTISIAFTDGSGLSYEAVKTVKPAAFVEAFNRLNS